MDKAARQTGLQDFGGDSFVPNFRRLLAALESESDLTTFGRIMVRSDVMRMLENRLRERVDGYHMLQIALENSGYECIVIDTPPSIGVLTSNALIASSHLVIPVQASYFALKGIENIMQTYQTIRQRARRRTCTRARAGIMTRASPGPDRR